ncbi:alpha-ketoglutarate-dependent dioxygenase AlkB [Aliiglaciecola sp. CAU 1673]|uniref:alpha-ketoglutarate-dependent dioxygenase AlkB family protein n=1 Tax=Aliiglaciecola sp. CAU 1673 TaxID=3032595 RepID=UPI0023DCD3DA|nr:alpha-ketoglutarate-dependent dioxygenase AlkB [Aliiglaciecola sp. CAU 1673]MDF2176785.1 alpha-ketoglutarate-dependent dioxygenase AlkB [Aliiglaciecola sp. CAU 1673]
MVYESGQRLQSGLFDEPAIALPDAALAYWPHWLSGKDAWAYFNSLRQALAWRQDHIKLYGKEVKIPRLQAWYGEPEASYQYSNLVMRPLPWHPVLLAIKQQCEAHTGYRFNAVLANCYRDGQDSMGWHADDEPELGPNPAIASVSLGEGRDMDFRHKHTQERYRLHLEHGSLLLMSGHTQHFWQHALPKRTKSKGERINLTFRWVYPSESTRYR